jgi:hypothetical protein
MDTKPKNEADDIRARNTPIFKLKDKQGRRFQAIHLVKQFGFVPEVIIVEKVHGMNNGLIVRAILTKEEKEREDKMRAEFAKKVETEELPVENKKDDKSNSKS